MSATKTINSKFNATLISTINTYDKNNFDSGVKSESIVDIPY